MSQVVTTPLQWTTVQRMVNDLVPYEKNPQKMSKAQEKKLTRYIEELGLVEIPAIDFDGIVIAGHKRCKVLQLLGRGQEMIDVRFPNRKLTDSEFKTYNIASNVNFGDWDMDLLEQEFMDIDLELFAGLNADLEKVYDKILDRQLQVDESEDEFESNLAENAITTLGDVYTFESPAKGLVHVLVCGDSTTAEAVAKALAGEVPIIMVTDPPYGVEYDPSWRAKARNGKIASVSKVLNDDNPCWEQVYSLFPGDVAYVWHAARFASVVQADLEACGLQVSYQIIWNKANAALSRGDYHWKHEPCWYVVREGKKHNWQGSRKETTVWDIANLSSQKTIREEGQTGHSTQKPLECMRRPILNNSAIGEHVYDPFCGSGSTLIASEQASRNCHALELSEKHCDMIVRRYIEYMRKQNESFQIKRNGNLLKDSELKAYFDLLG